MLKLRPAILAVVGWTALGLLFAAPMMNNGGEWLPALKNSLAQWWAWGIISMLIAAVDRRLPFNDHRIGLRLLSHVPISIVLTSLFVYVALALRVVLGTASPSELISTQMLVMGLRGGLLWSLLVYWLILGGWMAKQYYQRVLTNELRVERLERLTAEAQMHALRLQLDPHFLFNALNTISSQVEAEPRLARSMIEHLGELLRLTLESNQQQHVPLAQELSFLGHYLAIQKIRFGDRLHFEQDIDKDCLLALVPSMLIQPLVENAIRHGISPRASGGLVRLTVRSVQDELLIRIEDDGVGLPTNWEKTPTEGIGLSVTRQRLHGFYASTSSSFQIRGREGGGVVVELSLPLMHAVGEVASRQPRQSI